MTTIIGSLAFSFILLFNTFILQGDRVMPEVVGKDLNGKKVVLPAAAPRKFILLGVASSVKSMDYIQKWAEETTKAFDGNQMYQVALYFAGFTENIKAISQDKIFLKMKENVSEDFYPQVLQVTEKNDELLSKMGITNKNEFYIVIIDPRHNIVHTESGVYTEKKMEAIADWLTR
ncbi:MAG: hypothetical protein SGJ04_04990 [Bacteroidota bacterium]|nr:hypothetical protein [Bacteroidota bacterium]